MATVVVAFRAGIRPPRLPLYTRSFQPLVHVSRDYCSTASFSDSSSTSCYLTLNRSTRLKVATHELWARHGGSRQFLTVTGVMKLEDKSGPVRPGSASRDESTQEDDANRAASTLPDPPSLEDSTAPPSLEDSTAPTEDTTPPTSTPASTSPQSPQPSDQPNSPRYRPGQSSKPPPNVAETLESWRRALAVYQANLASEVGRRVSMLGSKVNEVTGYNDVEMLKRQVAAKEDDLRSLRELARKAKLAYDEAVALRSTTQREVNSLLERKHSWTDSDVATFTTLVRSDHSSSSAVSTASSQLESSERAVDTAFTALTRAILERYHEEQVWSDKIRAVSTWAGIAAIVVNLVVFVGAIAFVEPWKRRRLVSGLEERVSGMMERLEKGMGEVGERIDRLEMRSGGEVTGPMAEVGSVSGNGDSAQRGDVPALVGNGEVPPRGPWVTWRFSPPAPTWFPTLPEVIKPLAEPSTERDLGLTATTCAVLFTAVGWALRSLRS